VLRAGGGGGAAPLVCRRRHVAAGCVPSGAGVPRPGACAPTANVTAAAAAAVAVAVFRA
jgi:hypothetical protein